MEPNPPPPPPSPRRKRPPNGVPAAADLPLFARKLSKPAVPKPPGRSNRAPSGRAQAKADPQRAVRPPTRANRVAWASPLTWLPVIALGMLISGVWLLLPRDVPDPPGFPGPDRAFPTVVVDAGHGGHDNGASNNGLREKDLTLDTALRLERHLRARGFPVVLTRRDDRFLELFDRAHIANQLPRALFVSVHFNDNTTASGDGVETFYAQQKAAFSDDGWRLAGLFEERWEAPPLDQGAGFAQAVQASIVEQLGVTDRGAKPRQLAVVRLTRCPAVLVEGGFLNNPAEARNLAREEYRERLAAAIADGVAAYHEQRLEEIRARTVARR